VQIRINERAAPAPSNASWLSRRSYPRAMPRIPLPSPWATAEKCRVQCAADDGWRAERAAEDCSSRAVLTILAAHSRKSALCSRWWTGDRECKRDEVGRTYPFSITTGASSASRAAVCARGDVGRLRANNEFAKKIPGEKTAASATEHLHASTAEAAQQWGMSIDLNVCTGVVRV